MAEKLTNTDVKLGEGTLLKEALNGIVADFEIDKGSNSKGSWVKWNSGELVQKGVYTYEGGVSNPTGSLFASSDITIPYPIQFLGSPTNITTTLFRNDRYGFAIGRHYNYERMLCSVVLTSTFGSGYPLYIHWEATGRWK